MSSNDGAVASPEPPSQQQPPYHVVLVTGAGGYLGQCLIHTLVMALSSLPPTTTHHRNDATTTTTATTRIDKIILADIYFPATFHFTSISDLLTSPPPPTTTTSSSSLYPTLQLLQGDISDPTYCDSLFQALLPPSTSPQQQEQQQQRQRQQWTVSIFHMGGVMSGDGERDFDLCLRVNLYGTLALLERTRQLTQQYYCNNNNDQPTATTTTTTTPAAVYRLTALPKFIFCSAGAIIGAGSPTDYIQCDDVISDQCRSTPHSTYGMTKSCCELLLSDYTRRNFCDGRAVRLPTIVVRAGLPNAATTSCYSSIIREPLAGRDLVTIPISHDVTHAVTSTRAAIRAILQLYTVPKERVDAVCGYDRTIFIPATSVTLHELYTTLLQKVIHVDSHHLLGHIDYSVDPKISNMVASFPHRINPARATQLHIPPSPSIETMIREYIEDFPSALVPNLQLVPPNMTSEPIATSRTTTTTTTTTTTATTIPTPIMTGSTLPKRIAIITGAGSGIGRAVAQRLVQSQKWMVILTGRTISTLRETQQLCGTDGETTITLPQSYEDLQPLSIQNHCLCIPTDVTIEADVIRLFDTVKEQFGRVDLLFNNAGINSTAASIEQVALPDFERVLATNVTGPFLCAREAMKIMSQQDPPGGRIINNGSLSSHVPRPHSTTYTTSKHALSGLTKCIALDGRKYNVACGQVDFGNIVTELSLNTNRPNVGALQANGSTTLVEPSMNVQDAAETIYTMANLPLDANILQMTVMATTMPFVGRG